MKSYHGVIRRLSVWKGLSLFGKEGANHGLLVNENNIAQQESFTKVISIDDAKAMFPHQRGENLIYRSLEEQLSEKSPVEVKQYLDNALSRIDCDVRRNELFGRDKVLATLLDIVHQRGKFVNVLGPPNCGKSFIMRHIQRKHPESVMLVDLRAFQGDIVAALLSQVTTSGVSRLITTSAEAIGSVLKTFNLTIPFAAAPLSFNTKELTEKIEERKVQGIGKALRELTDRYSSFDKPLTFIIDDADLAFDPESNDIDRSSASWLLNFFVDITKRTNNANVILVSSNLSFPYTVSNTIRFNAAYFTNIIFIGELLPKEIWHVMVERWKLPEDLARSLIAYYGGDWWTINNALQHLRSDLEQFNPRSVWSHTLEDDIVGCLDWAASMGPEKEAHMRQVLEDLCVKGFAPLTRLHDPIAEHVSSKYIGSVVKNTNNVVGLDDSLWQEAAANFNYAMIPSKQWLRLAIGYSLAGITRP